MINIVAHQSTPQHVHTGDSTSPAIYIGVVVVVTVLLLVGVSFLLSKSNTASDSAENDTKTD